MRVRKLALTGLSVALTATLAVTGATYASAATAATPPVIAAATPMAHLTQLMSFATASSNTRVIGSAGFTSTVNYIKAQLASYGWTVTTQTFTVRGKSATNVIGEW